MTQVETTDGYYWNQLSESSKKMFNADRVARHRNPERYQETESRVDIGVDLSRRKFFKGVGAAGAGTLVFGGAVVTSGCGKNISIYTATVIGTLKELLPLLPNLSPRIKQAIALAETFDAAYRDGKFANAATIFENLTLVVGDIFNAIGVMNPNVKLAVAVGGVALRAIAAILKSQAADPVVAAAVASSPNTSAVMVIERMADISVFDRVIAEVKP